MTMPTPSTAPRVSLPTQWAPAPGDHAELIAAPGHRTEHAVQVLTVDGRTITARPAFGSGSDETYTLRRNGKWARKGSGQWAMFLRPIRHADRTTTTPAPGEDER